MTRLLHTHESRDTRVLLRDPATCATIDAAIVELRRRRVSYRAIGEALDVLGEFRLTEGQVRHRARKLRLAYQQEQA